MGFSLTITPEESNLPVWQQVQNNGSLGNNEVEIRDASTNELMNDLNGDTDNDNFSDEDNDSSDNEEEEDVSLHLRNYQNELAEVALTGRSCVICAPTGSGKTKVSVHIILEHLRRHPGAKVAFFARSVPLAKQQYQTLEKHLPDYNILLMTGESENSMSLHKLLPGYSVAVLTPMILVNHLCGRNPLLQEGVAIFTLLVFDECHHTREGEPYNNIMYYYLKEKRLSVRMPQVVGLTASIGVEKAKNAAEAEASIMKVCGNLNVDHLAIVKRNVQELQRTVPVPREVERPLIENEESEAALKILDIINKLERIAQDCAVEGGNDDVSRLLSNVPASKKHPEYCQWAVKLHDVVKRVRIPDERRETFMAFRNINIISSYLKEYHFALESIELAQTHDVMRFLDRRFRQFGNNDARAPRENHFYELFEDWKDIISRQEASVNNNLEILTETLREYVVRKGEEACAIVFVRTRMLAEAISSWLCRCGEDDIMELNARKFTSTNASEEQGGMSSAEQQSVLAEFRSGEVRVLVATVGDEGLDIPQCNLVVKYNVTGNEVNKVQTRGRSRAADGISILLGFPDILQRERMNRIRVQLMTDALSEISKKSQEEFRQDVDAYQAGLFQQWDYEDFLEDQRRRNMRDVNFKVFCHLCKRVAVESRNVRTIYEKYRVSIYRNLLDHIKIVPCQECSMDEILFIGKAVCLGETEHGGLCGNVIGTMVKHKGCPFVTLGIKNIVFQCSNEPLKTFKQWKKVPYFVEELKQDELMEYATAIWMPDGGQAAGN